MPTSFFTNGGRISPKTMLKNNAQARSSTLSQYSDDTPIYNSTFVTRNPKNHPSNFLAITPEPTTPQLSEKGTWLGNFSGGILDVDVESSIISSVDPDDDSMQQDSEQDSDMHTMSGLGPCLRFHSRAPWELEEEDDIDEEDEASYDVLLASNANSRPSVESYHSQRDSKKSFESTSSQVHPRGALYALAQESLSTSSLGSSLGQAPSLTTASLERVRSESAGTSSSMTLGIQSSHSIPSKSLPPHATTGTRAYNSRKHFQHESSHPYANPAFALSHESTSSMHETPATVFRTESRTTVTDSIAHQAAASTSKLDIAPSFTPFNFRRKQSAPSIHGREISSPMAVSNSAVHMDDVASLSDNHQSSAVTSSKSGHLDHIPGWTDRGVPPPFNLISLEEARAQRTRAGTQSSDPQVHTPFTNSLPFPTRRPTADDSGMEAQRVRSVSTSGAKAGLASFSSPSSGKQDQEPADSGSSDPSAPPPGKVVKHRKSGFLRLFGGRTGDKEDKTPVPPLPPIATDINTSKKFLIPRSPVHEFSPTVLMPSSEDFAISPTDSRKRIWDQSPSPKRATPPANLSINTRSPIDGKGRSSTLPERKVNTDVTTSPISQDMPQRPWLDASHPQSAPPNVTEFPPLRLRPVSAFFSSQFDGLLDAEVSSPEEPTTPSSTIPSNFSTPITPVSYTGRPDIQRKAVREVDHSPKPSLAGTESISSGERAWQQQHIRDLEVQVRNLQAELAEIRAGHYCTACGRGGGPEQHAEHGDRSQGQKHGVMHRPRAPTGNISRFVNNLT